MRVLVVIAILLFGSLNFLSAQNSGIDYSEEYLLGLNLNTNAGFVGGGMFRYAKKVSSKRLYHFGLEIVNVKHPKEIRQSNQVSGNLYILGKRNYLFAIRPSYGQEFLLFSKGQEDGIQIDALIGGGPSFGMVKPYYIEYDYITYTAFEPFDPAIHTDNYRILGSGGMFTGLSHSKFVPGFHFKSGLSFEYGSFTNGVTGIEVGCLIEGYTKRIELLDIIAGLETYNRQFYSSLYLNIYFGAR